MDATSIWLRAMVQALDKEPQVMMYDYASQA
jgi:hypothetical protein